MGVLSWLFSGSRRGGVPINLSGPGTYSTNIVGESNYQSALEAICGGRTEEGHKKIVVATIVHEDKNRYDNMAVRVDIGKKTVGYFSRENARKYRDRIKAAGYPGRTAMCSAKIVGGWDYGDGDIGDFGVKLDLPKGNKPFQVAPKQLRG